MLKSLTLVAGAAALSLVALTPARAEVAMSGTYTARLWCQGYQSIRNGTNPGKVRVKRGQTYAIVAKNKPDATYYRVLIDGAEPRERWVRSYCGRVDATARPAPSGTTVSQSPGNTSGGQPQPERGGATHVLALGWQPAFCARHTGKTECRELTSDAAAAKQLSLHGLWPQPRGTQYCNVPSSDQRADQNHNWDGLPEPDLSTDTRKRLSAVMPGVKSNLQRHEWIVHGTCFGTNADSYFARAVSLAETVDTSEVSKLFAVNAGRVVTAADIRAAFDAAFGRGAGLRVAISCGGKRENRKITELVINLSGDVKGTAPLRDLIQAAPTVSPGCPAGLVETAPSR